MGWMCYKFVFSKCVDDNYEYTEKNFWAVDRADAYDKAGNWAYRNGYEDFEMQED